MHFNLLDRKVIRIEDAGTITLRGGRHISEKWNLRHS